MKASEKLISKIEKLPKNSLIELEKYVDELIENDPSQNLKKCITKNQLEKLKNKPDFENIDNVNLIKCFRKEWDIVKQNVLLTNFIIDIFLEFSNPKTETFGAKRMNSDSRTGGFFEDKFGSLLNIYLRSKPDLWSPENKFEKIEMTINQSIAVPRERRKRKPDILITDYKTGEPICIIELKASFTKRSLIKIYNTDYEMWKRLNGNIKFLYVILRSSSENKTNTYQKVDGCRVICYDLKTDKDSRNKRIKPTIVTPLEEIFEEVYHAILDFRLNQ